MSERKWFTGRVLTFSCLVLALAPSAGYRTVYQATATAAGAADAQPTAAAALLPTAHPPIPSGADDFWLVPNIMPSHTDANAVLYKRFAEGIDNIDDDNFTAALPKVSDVRLQKTPFADYAAYYTALAQLRTGRADQARAGFQKLRVKEQAGVLAEWSLVGEAQAAEAQLRFADAAPLYEQAVARKATSRLKLPTLPRRSISSAPASSFMAALARAARRAGPPTRPPARPTGSAPSAGPTRGRCRSRAATSGSGPPDCRRT